MIVMMKGNMSRWRRLNMMMMMMMMMMMTVYYNTIIQEYKTLIMVAFDSTRS